MWLNFNQFVFLWPSTKADSLLLRPLCWGEYIFLALSFLFHVVCSNSGFTPPPPPPPPRRPYGNRPMSLQRWRHLPPFLITPTVARQRYLFLCHQRKVLSLSPGKMKLCSRHHTPPFHPPPPETNYSLVCDSLSLKCVHINPGLCSVYLSPLRTTGHSLILFILNLMAQWFTRHITISRLGSVIEWIMMGVTY